MEDGVEEVGLQGAAGNRAEGVEGGAEVDGEEFPRLTGEDGFGLGEVVGGGGEQGVVAGADGELRFGAVRALPDEALDGVVERFEAGAGWCAHIMEQKRLGKLVRPAAIYVGPEPRSVQSVAGWDKIAT